MPTITSTLTSNSCITNTSVTWTQWHRHIQIASAATSASTNIWNIWHDNITCSATSTIWPMWIQDGTAAVAPRASPEEVQRQLRQQAANQARAIEIEGERAKARERAELLLRESLSEQQKEELAARGHFHLTTLSADGQRRRYRIDRGQHGNVKQVDESGRVLKSLCAQPNGVPDADAMLAQKLWLETREEEFLKIANHRNYG